MPTHRLFMSLVAVGVLAACGRPRATPRAVPQPAIAVAPAVPSVPSLAAAFQKHFAVGAAINATQISGRDTIGMALVASQYNTISPENVLKWEEVHPRKDGYDFGLADGFVAFGERHKMRIIGHTLVWHNQTPAWVFRDDAGQPISRDSLVARLRNHIYTVVGRYKGRIHGWDVVNEALEENGTLRQTPWLRLIGDDYIELAFRFAQEADPQAELYYNDYSLENPAKREGAVRLLRRLLERGVKVTAVGMQGHFKMDWPTVEMEDSTITAFASLGLKVHMTEVDIDVLPPVVSSVGAEVTNRGVVNATNNPFAAGLPDEQQRALAKRYAELFAVFLKHEKSIDRVTFWGVADGDSWLNNWPARGRTAHPLLFDRAHKSKMAFDAVLSTVLPKVP